MLTWFKAFLRSLLFPSLFTAGFLAMAITVFKDAKWGLYLMVALIPQPNIWYKFHRYASGTNFMDFLYAAVVVGILLQGKRLAGGLNLLVILLFILASYLSLWNASMRYGLPAPITTNNLLLFQWKNYAQMISLYLLVMAVANDEYRQKVVAATMAAVVLFVSLRCVRNFNAAETFRYDHRVVGPFETVNLAANHFAAFVVCAEAFLLAMLLLDRHRLRRPLYVAALIMSIYPLFFAYSRGAYLAGLGVLVLFGLLERRILLAVTLALLVSWQTLLPETVVERITMTRGEGGEIEGSAAHRLDLWNFAMQLYRQNPAFGVGFGGFGMEVPAGELTDTHNFYVKTLSEQGLIGLGLLVIVFFCALRSGWRLYRRATSDFHRGLGLGFLGCVAATMVTNMFGDRWSYFVLGGYFWVLWGMVDRGLWLAERP